MSAYLITGLGGSGKSTICAELKRRDLTAFDGDAVLGLSRWEDLETGLETPVDASGYVDYSKVAWNWNGEVLNALLKQHDSLFLCGSASNQLKFHSLFDKVFVLTLDPKTHDQRLRLRTSEYGKHPDTRREIIQEQQAFVLQASRRPGAVAVDAARPLLQVVDDILGKCE